MNRPLRRFAIAGLALGASAALTLPVGADSFSTDQRSEIEAIVRDYILNNPEIIRDAIILLQAKEEEAQVAALRNQILANADALLNDPEAPVGGNPDGDVTIVEFFDYQCGYCKAVDPSVKQLLAADDGVRLVYKEFPILGPNSVTAARAALASRAQGKYHAFHDVLMAHRGQLDEATIMKLAASVGLDVDRLQADMKDKAIDNIIAANMSLAQSLGINGTPSFIIGEELVPGAVSLSELRNLVIEARAD